MRVRRQILLLGTDDPSVWVTLFGPPPPPKLRWIFDRNFYMMLDDDDLLQNILTREYIPPPRPVTYITIRPVLAKVPALAEAYHRARTLSPEQISSDMRESMSTTTEKYKIQGVAANQWEYNLYVAARQLGYRESDIMFQVAFDGGRTFKGGFIVDFIFMTRPAPTPVWVNGDWWHQGGRTAEDIRQQGRLMAITNGSLRPAVTLIEENVRDVELAKWAILDKIGPP